MVVVQVKSVLLWTLISLQVIASASAKIQYGIMIDAGSSGSRLHIYSSVDDDGVLEVSEVAGVEADPDKAKPGLASFANHPEDIDAYLQPLLVAAQEAIPADHHKTTPIFLMATAGMRLLSKQDADVVIKEVVELFSDEQKCPFQFKPENAEIITGQWEGIYAWITVNFLQGVFVSQSRARTYGILDLGGASHQNAFKFRKNRPGVKVLTLGGTEYDVFARTYLEYGQDEARKRFKKVLVKGSEYSSSEVGCKIENPCQFKGYVEVNDIDGKDYTFNGTDNIKECRSIIKKIFFCKEDSEDCPFHDQPRLRRRRFYGVSSIYYILNGIGMLENTATVTPRRVGSAADTYCKLSYDDVSDDPYAHGNCFGANYIFELFKDGYNLRANKMITVKSSLNGFKLGWSLGALLYNTEIL